MPAHEGRAGGERFGQKRQAFAHTERQVLEGEFIGSDRIDAYRLLARRVADLNASIAPREGFQTLPSKRSMCLWTTA